MRNKATLFSYLTLFTSLSTLLCCALPIVFVSLGAGALFAAISSKIPFINVLGENFTLLFTLSVLLLALAGYFIFIKPQSCPTDKKLANICTKSKKINKIIWLGTVAILITSFFFKYILILIV